MCSSISSVAWQIRSFSQFFILSRLSLAKIRGHRLQLFQSAQDHSPEFWGEAKRCWDVSSLRGTCAELAFVSTHRILSWLSFLDPAGIRRIPGICSESDWTFGPKTDMQGALDARPSQTKIKWAFNLEHGFSRISQTHRSHLHLILNPSVHSFQPIRNNGGAFHDLEVPGWHLAQRAAFGIYCSFASSFKLRYNFCRDRYIHVHIPTFMYAWDLPRSSSAPSF